MIAYAQALFQVFWLNIINTQLLLSELKLVIIYPPSQQLAFTPGRMSDELSLFEGLEV